MAAALAGYLPYLALTWAVEVPLLLFVLRRDASHRRIAGTGLLCSGLTHPLLWFAWPKVVPLEPYAPFAATGEGLVVTIEAALIWALILQARADRLGHAALASLAANAASFGVGLLLQALRAGW
jgi:hypothetical protein